MVTCAGEIFTCGSLEARYTIAHSKGIAGGFLEKGGRGRVCRSEREVGVCRGGSLWRREVEMLRKFQRLTSHGAEEVVINIRTKPGHSPKRAGRSVEKNFSSATKSTVPQVE
jgi:hypothetical protein